MDPLEKFKTDFARLRSEAHQPTDDKADDKLRPKRRANGAAPASPAQNSLREFGDSLPGDELGDDVPFGITEPRPIDEQIAQKAGERIADPATALDVRDAGDDTESPPPRRWLTDNQFCRRFLSGLLGPGATGKTALRVLQYLSLATGRTLAGQHIFRRCRVLMLSFEDDQEELQRRILAARLHHGIKAADVKGWLFYSTPKGIKLAEMRNGTRQRGALEQQLRRAINHWP